MIINLQYKPGLGKSVHLQLLYWIKRSPIKEFIFFKGNYKKISEKIHECNWRQNLQELSLPEAWETLTEKLIQLIEENVPVRKVSNDAGMKNPYVSCQCMVAIKQKHTKWQKYLHNKTEHNYTQYKVARNYVITELCRSKYNYEKDLAAKIKVIEKQ